MMALLYHTSFTLFYVKNLTSVLIYVVTTIQTLLHSYMFQPTNGHPYGENDTYCEQGQQHSVQI